MIKDSYILITGSSSGIGKEIAIQLSRSNNIILHGRDQEKLEGVKILCDPSYKHLIWNADLNLVEDIEISLDSFINENDISIGSYVHSAGYMKIIPARLINIEFINRSFNTNVISASLIVKTLLQKSRKNSLKSIVFISSNISNRGARAFSIYGSTKGALDSLMMCLSVELAPRVRVNSVLPGAIPTDMTEDIFKEENLVQKMKDQYPLGIGRENDIYHAVEFLISENSRWITGQQITVDGGRSINISS